MNTLILTVGLPRSGKSTWCRAQTGKYPVVNPDSIRMSLYGTNFIDEAEEMIWTVAHLMVKALFLAGHNIVIVDSTNLTKWQREDWAKKICAKIEYKVFNTNVATCIERARKEGREELIPIIEKMYEESELDDLVSGHVDPPELPEGSPIRYHTEGRNRKY